MLATHASECGSSGSADTSRRQGLSAGNSAHPAMVGPTIFRAGLAESAGAARKGVAGGGFFFATPLAAGPKGVVSWWGVAVSVAELAPWRRGAVATTARGR